MRETLRTFHITGRGLEDWTPAAPLHPTGVEHLPQLPLDAATLPELHAAALSAARGPARANFLAKLNAYCERLLELLARENRHSTEVISASLGAEAAAFLDA